MKTLAFAVAATAVLSAGVAAEQAATAGQSQTPAAAPKLAASHPSTQPGTGPSARPAAGAPSALAAESQNQLVGQYCATCHSERGKAGGLVLAGFDAAKIDQHPDVAEKM